MAENCILDAKMASVALPSKKKCCSPFKKKCTLQKSVLPKVLAKKVFSPIKVLFPKCSPTKPCSLQSSLVSEMRSPTKNVLSPISVYISLDKCPLQSASTSDKCSPWSSLLPKSALLPKKCSPLVLSPQKVPFSKCSPHKKRIPQSALPSKCALFKVLSSCILREGH